MTRTRTIAVRSTGSHTFRWNGFGWRGRYRVSMKLPNGKKVRSTSTIRIVCSEGRKADPVDFPEC